MNIKNFKLQTIKKEWKVIVNKSKTWKKKKKNK